MELEYKKDFDNTKEQWDSFWQGKNTAPLIGGIVPKKQAEPVPMPHQYDCTFGEFGPAIEQTERHMATHEYVGAAIPTFRISFTTDHFAALLGADIKPGREGTNTTWAEPFVTDWDKADLSFKRNGYWWERTVSCIRAFRAAFDGKLIVQGPSLQGGLDCLSAVRGVNELLTDLIMAPDDIKAALNRIDDSLKKVYEALRQELGVAQYGSITRHHMYCSGLIDIPQCDFSCMISPEMFQEFGLPSIRRQADNLDAAEYHLDGPGAIQHLESICTIDKISVIQWMPGAGEAASKDWTDLYKQIDNFGKGTTMWAIPDEIRKMAGLLNCRHSFYKVIDAAKDEIHKLIDEISEAHITATVA